MIPLLSKFLMTPSEFTTIGIGGAADRMVFPTSAREVQEVVRAERAAGRPVLTLGAGSNILAADDGVHGEELWKTDGTGAGTTLVAHVADFDDPYCRSPFALICKILTRAELVSRATATE